MADTLEKIVALVDGSEYSHSVCDMRLGSPAKLVATLLWRIFWDAAKPKRIVRVILDLAHVPS